MNLIDTFFPDHFSLKDRLAIFAAAMLSIISFTLLLKVRPRVETRAKDVVARIERMSNNVRYKESGSVSFYNASVSEGLQVNDEIFTGENSQVIVRFLKSSTVLKIPSSSLIRIEESESGDAIEVQDGVVDVVIAKDKTINLKSNGVVHQISSPTKESVIKAYNSSGELRLFTKDKGLKIKTDAGQKDLASDVDVTLTSKVVKVKPSFTLLSPTPGEKLESTRPLKIVTNQNSKYEVRLSDNADFSSTIYRTRFEGTSFEWDRNFEEGNYFLKVEDKNDHKSIPIVLASKLHITGFLPKNGELVNVDSSLKTILKWDPLPVKSYKVLVRNNSGKEHTYVTPTNQIEIGELKGLSIEWAVAPEIGEDRFAKFSPLSRIDLNFIGKIEFTEFPPKKQFRLKEGNVKFSWKAHPEEKFSIKLFDGKTNAEIFSKQSQEPTISFPLDTIGLKKLEISSLDYQGVEKAEFQYEIGSELLAWDANLPKEMSSMDEGEELQLRYKSYADLNKNARLVVRYKPVEGEMVERKSSFSKLNKIKLKKFGQYCFKALPLETVEFYTESQSYCVNYVELPPFTSLPKAPDAILSLTKYNGAEAYKIAAPSIPRAKKYKFEFYRDSLGKELVYTAHSAEPHTFWASRRSGIYYFKYKVYDIKNRESEFSPISKITFPISPLSDW